MTYHLAFWQGGDPDVDPEGVYLMLSGGGHVDDVDAVDLDAIRAALDGLDGWSRDRGVLRCPGPDGPVFEVAVGPQMIEFVGDGVGRDHINAVIDVMHPLGLRLYDPQVGERFA